MSDPNLLIVSNIISNLKTINDAASVSKKLMVYLPYLLLMLSIAILGGSVSVYYFSPYLFSLIEAGYAPFSGTQVLLIIAYTLLEIEALLFMRKVYIQVQAYYRLNLFMYTFLRGGRFRYILADIHKNIIEKKKLTMKIPKDWRISKGEFIEYFCKEMKRDKPHNKIILFSSFSYIFLLSLVLIPITLIIYAPMAVFKIAEMHKLIILLSFSLIVISYFFIILIFVAFLKSLYEQKALYYVKTNEGYVMGLFDWEDKDYISLTVATYTNPFNDFKNLKYVTELILKKNIQKISAMSLYWDGQTFCSDFNNKNR